MSEATFLLINNIPIMVSDYSESFEETNALTTSLKPYKRVIEITTSILSPKEADGLEYLISGQCDHIQPLTSSGSVSYTDKGRTVSPSATISTSGPLIGGSTIYCLYFSSNGNIYIPSYSTNKFSLCGWFKRETSTYTVNIDGSSSTIISLSMGSSSITATFYLSSGSQSVQINDSNTWRFIGVTYSNLEVNQTRRVSLYVNGQESSATVSYPLSGLPIKISIPASRYFANIYGNPGVFTKDQYGYLSNQNQFFRYPYLTVTGTAVKNEILKMIGKINSSELMFYNDASLGWVPGRRLKFTLEEVLF